LSLDGPILKRIPDSRKQSPTIRVNPCKQPVESIAVGILNVTSLVND
jgi:hypothetical protein